MNARRRSYPPTPASYYESNRAMGMESIGPTIFSQHDSTTVLATQDKTTKICPRTNPCYTLLTALPPHTTKGNGKPNSPALPRSPRPLFSMQRSASHGSIVGNPTYQPELRHINTKAAISILQVWRDRSGVHHGWRGLSPTSLPPLVLLAAYEPPV